MKMGPTAHPALSIDFMTPYPFDNLIKRSDPHLQSSFAMR